VKRDRLPPGQRLREDFSVLHYGSIPQFNEDTWDFAVTGLVETLLKLTYKEFMSLPSTRLTTDFHCVTGWSKFALCWKGVLFKTIANRAKLLQQVRFVSIFSEYGYTTNLPVEVVMGDDVIFAYEYNEKPLTPEHGFPLRLVVPKLYAYKSAKWVRGIEFLKENRLGFWETRGYSNSADPWKEERFG
jgi:DMSO/TMAO reductase YedYZ molybdopterin-dependent catalytic subunit